MVSEWILGRLAEGAWIGFYWLKIGTVASCCEYGDESSGYSAKELVNILGLIALDYLRLNRNSNRHGRQ
jgi:hypothetical protein